MMQRPLTSTLDRKARLKTPHQPVPEQEVATRVRNWDEVYLGYDLAAARTEASRCIQCPVAPCRKACPLHNDIVGALRRLEAGDVLGAAETFRRTSILPEVCGRLCPQERLCEGACVVGKVSRPAAIGRLEAFCADYQREHGGRPLPVLPPPSGRRVAVIGSGPAGLAAAEELAHRGHAVEVFEAWPEPGGVLAYGIPGFKMARHLVEDHVDDLRRLGVRFHVGLQVGAALSPDQLLARGFDALFLSHGASEGHRLGVPGEALPGVYQATEFLVRANLGPEALPRELRGPLQVGARVVVVGGGDTAMDCVRTAVRLGAGTVHCLYRRSETELTGREEERRRAREEGVQFLFRAVPVAVLAGPEGRVRAVRCQRVALGPPDESGRPRPLPIAGSEFELAADTVVAAVGYRVETDLAEAAGIESTPGGQVAVDASGATSRPAVFAAGDCVRGADLVVTALADARRAAEAIDRYLVGLDVATAAILRHGGEDVSFIPAD